jgi:hypothetical protein
MDIKIRWREVNICGLGSGKWFFSCIFAHFAKAGKKHSKAVHLLEKRVINMISLLLLVFDWPIMMIDPGGLLLVVWTYFQSLRKSLMGGVPKKWITKLGCEKYFSGITYWALVAMLLHWLSWNFTWSADLSKSGIGTESHIFLQHTKHPTEFGSRRVPVKTQFIYMELKLLHEIKRNCK